MVEDVRLAVQENADVRLFGKMGGVVPMPDEILAQIQGALPPLPETTISVEEALVAAYL